MTVRLDHTAGPAEKGDAKWQPLAPKAGELFTAARRPMDAAPAEVFADFTLDPRAAFDVSRPGTYRLRLDFTRAGGGIADGPSREFLFTVRAEAKEKR